jgi:hypothetical protein
MEANVTANAYTSFQPTWFRKSCTFLYPANWEVHEILEVGYEKIFIAGPSNQAGTFNTSLIVRVSPATDQIPEEAARLFVSKYQSAFNCQVEGMTFGKLGKKAATEVELAYSMALPLNSVSPQMTKIRERHIFLKHVNRLFELLYAASEEDYATWLEAFRVLVQTFSFLDKSQTILSRPFVAEAWGDTTESCDERNSGEKSQ